MPETELIILDETIIYDRKKQAREVQVPAQKIWYW